MKTSQDGIEFEGSLRDEFEYSFLSVLLDGKTPMEALRQAWDDVLTPVYGETGDSFLQKSFKQSLPFDSTEFDWDYDKELLK